MSTLTENIERLLACIKEGKVGVVEDERRIFATLYRGSAMVIEYIPRTDKWVLYRNHNIKSVAEALKVPLARFKRIRGDLDEKGFKRLLVAKALMPKS